MRTVLDIRWPVELCTGRARCATSLATSTCRTMLDRDMEQVRDFRDMTRTHRWQVDNRGEPIAAILRVMAEERAGGLLFHCLVCKDRPG